MAQKFNVDKAWVAADPLTAVLSSLVTIAAIFGLWTWLGLTADQVALLGGSLTTLGAGLRTMYVRKSNSPGGSSNAVASAPPESPQGSGNDDPKPQPPERQ